MLNEPQQEFVQTTADFGVEITRIFSLIGGHRQFNMIQKSNLIFVIRETQD